MRIDLVLPALGLVFYSAIFALSLIPKASLRRLGALGAQFGALGALGFLVFQGAYLGAWCQLCVGVDTSAILAALTALPFVKSSVRQAPLAKDERARTWRSLWWPAWALAVGVPLAWGFTAPPSPIPDGVRARYVDGDQREAMTRLVYEGSLVRDALIDDARQLRVDEARFVACLDDPATDARVQDNLAYAKSVGMEGLPTTYIGERTLLGFDSTGGAEPFREALAAARTDRPTTRSWWPFALVALVALALAVLTRPRMTKMNTSSLSRHD